MVQLFKIDTINEQVHATEQKLKIIVSTQKKRDDSIFRKLLTSYSLIQGENLQERLLFKNMSLIMLHKNYSESQR